MLSSVTINCHLTKIVMNPGYQFLVSQMSQVENTGSSRKNEKSKSCSRGVYFHKSFNVHPQILVNHIALALPPTSHKEKVSSLN